ncbi:hypothetical protein [Phytohabitans aurantiacus]|nr:hypothetical protein [Phytohabitans aurantiacus]
MTKGNRTTMSINLYFDLAPVALLAEHALAAPSHAVDPDRLSDPAMPTLWLVKGAHGIWLASNGLPGIPIDVLVPDADTSRVFAHGWAPGDPALPGRLATLDLRTITVIGVFGQPIDDLPDLLRQDHTQLRITVHGAFSTLSVDADPQPDPITGEPTDPITNWLKAALGQTVTGRPWRADLDHPCPARCEIARLLDEAAAALSEATDSMRPIAHDLAERSRDTATDLTREGWTNITDIAALALAAHTAQARQEILRNHLAQLHTAWHHLPTGHGCQRTRDQNTTASLTPTRSPD